MRLELRSGCSVRREEFASLGASAFGATRHLPSRHASTWVTAEFRREWLFIAVGMVLTALVPPYDLVTSAGSNVPWSVFTGVSKTLSAQDELGNVPC